MWLYEMNRDSIASVMFFEGGLPSAPDALDRRHYRGGKKEAEVYDHLVNARLIEFPGIGRIEDMYLGRGVDASSHPYSYLYADLTPSL